VAGECRQIEFAECAAWSRARDRDTGAGYTRDVIEEAINLDGLPVVLWDTAGLRENDDQIETIGVNLSRQYLEKADALIVVLDGRRDLPKMTKFSCAMSSKESLNRRKQNDLPKYCHLKIFRDLVIQGQSSGCQRSRVKESTFSKKN